MKIKLLVAAVLILALGTNTAEAQNRQRSGEQNQFGHHDRKGGGFSRSDKRGNTKEYGYERRKYGRDRAMKSRHRGEFNRHEGQNHRFNFHKKRYNRRHRF